MATITLKSIVPNKALDPQAVVTSCRAPRLDAHNCLDHSQEKIDRRFDRYMMPMAQSRSAQGEKQRLGHCLIALRAQAKSTASHRRTIIERRIENYLRADPVGPMHALERLRRAIQIEEAEQRDDEDWSVVKDYVRSLLNRLAS
jgi:hypothetical protein